MPIRRTHRIRARRSGGDVLYICGNNFEDEASGMLREAFTDAPDLRLRVRLHPRNDEAEMREAVRLRA